MNSDLQQIADELDISLEEAARLQAELTPPADLQQLAERLDMAAEDLAELRLAVPSFYNHLRELAQMPRDTTCDRR